MCLLYFMLFWCKKSFTAFGCSAYFPPLTNILFKLDFCRSSFFTFSFSTISANGKGLCEVRATATEISRGDRMLAKTIFIFSNLQKKMKWFFAGTAYKFSEIIFNPASCKTHVVGSAIASLFEQCK